MALTSWSTSNYLRRLALVYDAYPFIIAGWGRQTGSFVGGHLASIGTAGTGADRHSLSADTSTVYALSRSTASGSTWAQSTAAPSLDTWFLMFGEFTAATDRAANLNNGNRGVNTGSVSPAASDSLHVGIMSDLTEAPWPATGALAELSIWDATGMTQANRASLRDKLYNGGAAGAGANPINVKNESAQPWTGKLKAYYLDAANTITDLSGNGNDLTMVGTLTAFGSHPNIEAVSGGGGGSEVQFFNRRRR
jgi:hypothetical protein